MKNLASKFCLFAFGLLTIGCGASSYAATLPANITVTLSAKRATASTSQGISISATTNDSAGVKWKAASGSFSPAASLSGAKVTYTAPISAGTFTVTATSVSNPGKSASMTVYVTDLAGVTTYHNDVQRDGANSHEYALSPSTVNTSTFGKLFSCTVDGAIYSQPLWMPNVNVAGVKHNAVFVATQHDSLYAFDADANPCVQLWKVSLVDSHHGGSSGELTVPSGPPNNLVGSGYGDITPEVGVTGTPVIDPKTGTLYAISKSMNPAGTQFYQRLHAIDITTGNEKFAGPANIGPSITYPGNGDGGSTVSFSPQQQGQRAGLALVNGVVYAAWASHEDNLPYYGWVVGFNASTLAIASVLNVTPNAQSGGIWMGGGAPSADSSGHLYLITGNGNFDANSTTAPKNDYGDSFLQLTSTLKVSSYFTPSDQQDENDNDSDFGSGGSAIVINTSTGTLKHLVIGGGKDGSLYLLNGDSMGGLGDPNARQNFYTGGSIFATGAFWNNNYYVAPVYTSLLQYTYNSSTNLFNTNETSASSTSFGFPGATPSVSANRTTNGIVWALDNTSFCTPQSPSCGPTVLHAYNATNLGTELWNSGKVSGDRAGNAVKFTVPTVANGRVYVGTRGNNTGGSTNSTSVPGELDVYGLKSN